MIQQWYKNQTVRSAEGLREIFKLLLIEKAKYQLLFVLDVILCQRVNSFYILTDVFMIRFFGKYYFCHHSERFSEHI
jgi:hypothetical protein